MNEIRSSPSPSGALLTLSVSMCLTGLSTDPILAVPHKLVGGSNDMTTQSGARVQPGWITAITASVSRRNRIAAVSMAIGVAVAAVALTGCEPVDGMSSEPASIVGVWEVTQYRVSITGSVQADVDLARQSDITVRFNESPRSYSFAYFPPLQGIGLAAELAEGEGTYDQDESRRRLTLEGRGLSGNRTIHTYNYTLSSVFLTLRLTDSFFRTTNGQTQSGTRTVTIMARRK